MSGFDQHVRASSANLSLVDLLQRPVTELLGVGTDAGAALGQIGVDTIFDLGSSAVFAAASATSAAAISPHGRLATDVLDATAPSVPAHELGSLSIGHLRGVSQAQAAALSAALDVASIRELALWPPHRLARQWVGISAGGAAEAMAEAAEVLRPSLGEYPTERVYYDTLVMLGSGAAGNLVPLEAPLSLGALDNPAVGFGAPVVGAIATYVQSWFAQGVTLGHMVHSLALAPGEATRIAVVDWSRRTSASASESISEQERMSNSTAHSRAISEVQNAVADEMQSGGSIATGWAKSSSKGSNFGGSIGGGIAGVVGSATGVLGFGLGGSKSSQSAETESRATSASWSVGSKSVMSTMNQHVNDRTEQNAASVRNRRASAVREVSQSEHEQVSTRIVANYNHMHALTIQYYEVVQVYRVSVRLSQVVRALFIPFEPMDFASQDAMARVARFRDQLLGAALTPRAADLLLDHRGKVEVRSAVRVPFAMDVRVLTEARLGSLAVAALGAGSGSSTVSPATAVPATTVANAGPAPSRLGRVRAGAVEEVLPGDATLVAVAFEDVGIDRVRIEQVGVTAETSTFVVPQSTDQVDFASGIQLRSVQGIHVARSAGAPGEGSLILRYESDGQPGIAVVPLSLAEGERMQKAAFLQADTANRRQELLAHLQAHRDHYTRAVLEGLDSGSLMRLLAGVSWQGQALSDQVEPRPVAVAGNCLVLKAPVDNEEQGGVVPNQTWKDLLSERQIDFKKEDVRLVPIPTGGVFAEAVLGRSNSAEKLDITRFWNWQDSPIPLQPPEIAPVATGSRAMSEDLRPGQLGAPVVSMMAPSTLPDPAGLSAVLGALANGGMFRDMSGLAGTQATAQAASAGTLTAATEAGRIASENLKTVTTQATEMGKAAADMWKAKNGGGGGAKGGGSGARGGGISGEGARINHGKDMDNRGVPGTQPSGGKAKPRITGESRPVFLGSAESSPPQATFSRELAYSDESAAVSPHLVGATTDALGSGNQELLGFLGPVGEVAGEFGQSILDALILAIIQSDAKRAGVAQGARLIPMRRHDNHLDFEGVEYAAWTNNALHVYVNIPLFIGLYRKYVGDGMSPGDAIRTIRVMTVLVIRHEEQHIGQFANNAGNPPAAFADMLDFELLAYGQDVTWLQDPQVQGLLLNDFGISQDTIDGLLAGSKESVDKLNLIKSNAPADLQQRMKDDGLIPQRIQGIQKYDIKDMYKTAPP